MPERGSVIRRRRRVGLGADHTVDEHFVVLSIGDLNALVPTWVVAPIEAPTAEYLSSPLGVRVGRAEHGGAHDAVIVTWALAAMPSERFDPIPVGRLLEGTLDRVDEALRAVLGLD